MSNKNQWRLLLGGLAAFFALTFLLMWRNRPVDVRLGSFPSQEQAWSAALTSLDSTVQAHPAAGSVTVHFQGPHAPPKDGEEAVSYNRRLGMLMAFVNRQENGKWSFAHIWCEAADSAKLTQMATESDKSLHAPRDCGCKIESWHDFLVSRGNDSGQ